MRRETPRQIGVRVIDLGSVYRINAILILISQKLIWISLSLFPPRKEEPRKKLNIKTADVERCSFGLLAPINKGHSSHDNLILLRKSNSTSMPAYT